MNIFLTSDTFFGRHLVSIQREFNGSEEMEDFIIQKWNETVKTKDVVYHLGNFAWDPISAERTLSFMNGTVFFVGGAYDKHLSENSLVQLKKHFLLPTLSEIPRLNSVLCHWPLDRWNGKNEDVFHFYGGESTEVQMKNRWCVNIEKWDYRPIELDFFKELKESIDTK